MRDRVIALLQESSVGVKESEWLTDNLLLDGVLAPPCKVGDTIYVLVGEPSQKIAEFRVRTIVFGGINDAIGLTNKSVITIWDKQWYDFFGKTIFLTREEAEQALKGEAHEHD